MLPAQRRAIVARALVGVLVVVGAFFVARATRVQLHEQNVYLVGETGMRHWEAARNAFVRGDGFPLWDRTMCGGGPSLADPESPLVTSLIAGVFRIHGDVMGRWYPTLAAMLGVLGMYAWCRRALEIGRVGSFWAGAVFVACGFLSLQTAGRMQFVPFFYIPWVLFFARVGEKDLRAAAMCGVVLALMILEGGLLPVTQASIAVLLVTAPRLANREHGPLPVARMLGVATLAFLLVGAVKLFPLAVQMARYPSHAHVGDGLKWAELMPIFIDKERFDGLAGHPFHFNEYRAYVGPLVLGAAIAGAGTAIVLPPRRWGLALLTLGSFLLVRGVYSPTAPYALLSDALKWNALIVPSRFAAMAAVAIAACGAVAIDAALGAVGKHRGLALIVLVIAFVGAWDPIVEGRKIFKAQGTQPWLPRPDPAPRPYFIGGDDPTRIAEFPEKSEGSLVCERLLEAPAATGLRVGEGPQASIDPPDAGVVVEATTLQNGYRVHAKTTRPVTMHLNTSWDPDWTSDVGTVKRSANGALDVVLPPGDLDVHVSYRPRGLTLGLLATILGLLGVAALFVRPIVERRRRGAEGKGAPPPGPIAHDPVETKIAA